MSAKHTPGPWKVIDTYNEMPVGCDGFVIENVDGLHIIPDGMQRLGCENADARLIAAAPDLLEALKLADEMASALQTVLEEIDQSGKSYILGSCCETSNRILSKWWVVSGAAIAKATGEAP